MFETQMLMQVFALSVPCSNSSHGDSCPPTGAVDAESMRNARELPYPAWIMPPALVYDSCGGICAWHGLLRAHGRACHMRLKTPKCDVTLAWATGGTPCARSRPPHAPGCAPHMAAIDPNAKLCDLPTPEGRGRMAAMGSGGGRPSRFVALASRRLVLTPFCTAELVCVGLA